MKKKYVVEWEVLTSCSVIVEAESEDEAETLVLDGEFDKTSLDEEDDFNGIMSVYEYVPEKEDDFNNVRKCITEQYDD